MRAFGTLRLDPVESGLRFEAHVNDRVRFVLNSGPGVAEPSPIEALLAAAGACTAMDVISILRKKRMEVTSYEVALEGERRDEHPKRFTKIAMVHRVRGRNLSVAGIEEAIHLSDTKYCSVLAAIRPTVEVTSRLEVEEEPAA